MWKKPVYKKLDLQVFATFFEIYSGKVSDSTTKELIEPRTAERLNYTVTLHVFKGVRPAKPQSQAAGPGGREAAGAGGRAAGEGGEMHRGRPQAHRNGKQLQVNARGV